MKILLEKKPKNPIIIEGFPGFGLISTIATEFLIENLKAEMIGTFEFEELPPTLAIHQGEIVHPMGVFYAKDQNMIILHTILNTSGYEWKVADSIINMYNELEAKELISIEGVAGLVHNSEKIDTYFFTTDKNKKENISKLGMMPLQESIIMGVTGAILLKSKMPVTCFFAQTMSNLPDSKGAATIIESLDKYLNLSLDTKPLIKQAEIFEKKLKHIQEQTEVASQEQEKSKRPSYLG